jgi:hypothetical protein
MEASLSIPLPAVLLNVEASSLFGNTLSDLLSEGQTQAIDSGNKYLYNLHQKTILDFQMLSLSSQFLA